MEMYKEYKWSIFCVDAAVNFVITVADARGRPSRANFAAYNALSLGLPRRPNDRSSTLTEALQAVAVLACCVQFGSLAAAWVGRASTDRNRPSRWENFQICAAAAGAAVAGSGQMTKIAL